MIKILSVISITLLGYQGLFSQSSITLSSFSWLVGTWENMATKPGETATETWTKDPTGVLIGMGVTVRGQDTVFVEKLKIVEKEGYCYYVADVSHNAAPVYFKMTTADASGFECENPEHDFPKKIKYQLQGDIINASISAGSKQIPFRFRRKK